MPMWLVWVILVIGAIVFLGWVVTRLWRAGKGLAAELVRAQETLERLEARMAELEEISQRAPVRAEIVLTQDRRRELHERRAQVKRIRRARKQARFERASAQWDRITG